MVPKGNENTTFNSEVLLNFFRSILEFYRHNSEECEAYASLKLMLASSSELLASPRKRVLFKTNKWLLLIIFTQMKKPRNFISDKSHGSRISSTLWKYT